MKLDASTAECLLPATGGRVDWLLVGVAVAAIAAGVWALRASRPRGSAARLFAVVLVAAVVGASAGAGGAVPAHAASACTPSPTASASATGSPSPTPSSTAVDFAIASQLSEVEVAVGSRVLHTVSVSHVGGTAGVAGVQVRIARIPGAPTSGYSGEGWSLVSQSADEFVYEYSPAIAAGESAMPLVAELDAAEIGAFVVSGQIVAGTGGDANPANDIASTPLRVAGVPNLTISVTPGIPYFSFGDEVPVSFTVTNVGTASTTGAPMTVRLTSDPGPNAAFTLIDQPTGWSLVSQDGTSYEFTSSDVLAPGATAAFAFTHFSLEQGVTYAEFTAVIAGGGESDTSDNEDDALIFRQDF